MSCQNMELKGEGRGREGWRKVRGEGDEGDERRGRE